MKVIVVMGVSGAGKTTVGQGLAAALGWSFCEGGNLHPRANVDKMSQGIPLSDADRQPWLEAIRKLIDEHIARDQSIVISCSALKQAYRDCLTAPLSADQVAFVYMKGSFELLRERIAQREGHYMPADLLASQFEVLEEPSDAITVDAAQEPDRSIQQILRDLKLGNGN